MICHCISCSTFYASNHASDSLAKDEKRKSVTFPEDDEVEVFYVEDWDRSPAAVVERLTYKYVDLCRCCIACIDNVFAALLPETYTN